MKTALVLGSTGQDAGYLIELLLEKGYKVFATYRRGSTDGLFDRITHLDGKINLICADLTDLGSLEKAFKEVKPDEVYNLAAQSQVWVSFSQPTLTHEVNYLGVERIIHCVKTYCPNAKLYQACHDTKTNVVSEKGIVKYTSLEAGDLVYTYNIKTKEIELKPILKKFEYDYDGDMVCVKNRRIDKMVTPNHNILLKKDSDEIVYCKAENLVDFLPYERNSKISLVKAMAKIRRGSKKINLGSIIDLSQKSKNHVKNLITKMDSNDLLYLFGLYLGDGFCKKNKIGMVKSLNGKSERNEDGTFKKIESKNMYKKEYTNSYVQFAIPKEKPARKKLIKVLKRNGITFKEHSDTIDFSSVYLSKIFRTGGMGFANKNIPEWIWGMPHESLYYLKDGLIDTDGHTRKNGREVFSTSSDYLLKDSLILFLKLGFFCSIQTRKVHQSFFKAESRYITATKPGYVITLSTKQTNKIYRDNISAESYCGKVWCFEMKDNNNFLVERNGKVSFCGNSTSEMFGDVVETPQNEKTPFNPVSPYAVAKVNAHNAIKRERDAGMFACSGVLHNHESPRRGIDFVTRKITDGVARLKLGLPQRETGKSYLELGNLNAKRDWGSADDYVRAMWMMLQQDVAKDYVISTGETRTVKEFVEIAAEMADIKITWKGSGIKEEGYDQNGKMIIKVNEKWFRPNEVRLLLGDSSLAKKELGWEPKISFKELVQSMLKSDLERLGR